MTKLEPAYWMFFHLHQHLFDYKFVVAVLSNASSTLTFYLLDVTME